MLVLLDVDGVICNFVQGVIDAHKLGITHDEWSSWNYHREVGMSDEEFWRPTLEVSWWEALKPYDYAHTLVENIRLEGHQIIYCSSPSLGDKCPSEKVRWLRAHGFMKGNEYVLTPHKHLLAGSGAILIDDSDANVEKFREAGGTAITFPAPWNRSRMVAAADRAEYVIAMLDLLKITNVIPRMRTS